MSTSQRAIQSFLERHREWLRSSFERSLRLQQKYPRAQYLIGEGFLYCGHWLRLDFSPSLTSSKMSVKVTEDRLLVQIPHTQWSPLYTMNPQPQVAHAVQKFYESAGRRLLAERLLIWQNRTQLHPKSIGFRNQKTRWGSCTSAGKISLNWRLVGAPIDVMDYVIVHELCHLRHANHSRSFWNLVGSYLPDYRQRQQWLKDNQYALDFLNRSSELYSEINRRYK